MTQPQTVDMTARQPLERGGEAGTTAFGALLQPLERLAVQRDFGGEILDLRLQLLGIRARRVNRPRRGHSCLLRVLPLIQVIDRALQPADLPGAIAPDQHDGPRDRSDREAGRTRRERLTALVGDRLVQVDLLPLAHQDLEPWARNAAPRAMRPGQRRSGSTPAATSNSSAGSNTSTDMPVSVMSSSRNRSARASPEAMTISLIGGRS